MRGRFQQLFDSAQEVGAGFCVYVAGRPVVDLWGGVADVATGRPWDATTPTLIFSSTKALAAICLLRPVERGAIALDAPVVDYWPEFRAGGKGRVSVREVLSHRAGVPAVDRPFDLDDVVKWNGVIAAVEAQRLEWEPGSTHGYHARTLGWIAGELVRRVTGRSLGTMLAD